jgi:Protein of unknown function (DUF3140)
MASEQDAKQIRADFSSAVNMTAAELRKWLDSDESKGVGQKKDGRDESTGHESGRRIVELIGTRAGDLDDDDLAHMKKVVGYVHRHLEQRPDKANHELAETAWRYSLMNWGHDPMK